MIIRKSSLFIAVLGCSLTIFTFLLAYQPAFDGPGWEKQVASMSDMVRRLGLTDLCLFTEARYTRHLSQADLNSAFQDYPLAFEHFPSGSLVKPIPLSARRSMPANENQRKVSEGRDGLNTDAEKFVDEVEP